MARLRREDGFTIVEVMVATAILLGGVLGTLAMMETANHKTRTAADRQRATALVRDVVEAVRAVPYRHTAEDTIVTHLQDADGLGGEIVAGDWRLERGGTTYTTDVDVCSLDDDADGLGTHVEGGFCSDSAATGTADASSADYKRVTVTASWENGSGTGRVRQATLVGARGRADAPAISNPVMTAPSTAPITNPATTTASFAVSTEVVPEAVVWTLDGVQQGLVGGGAKDYEFSWELPSLDGAYDVGVQAFDSSGVSGAPKSTTVVLNRFLPGAPGGWIVGRNGSVVEAVWRPNPERDILGYQVYRRSGSVTTLVCDVEVEAGTSCIDPSPPARTSTALTYWVVALDTAPAGGERAGAASPAVDVNLANRPPNAPRDLTYQPMESGMPPVLRWTLPRPADPDRGDSIAFFRIYRDGTTVAHRHERTNSGTEIEWTDAEAESDHRYWITAVDTHLQESALVGPVGQ